MLRSDPQHGFQRKTWPKDLDARLTKSEVRERILCYVTETEDEENTADELLGRVSCASIIFGERIKT